MLMKRMPLEFKIDFMSVRMIAFALSGLMLLATAALIPMRGLNLGIDFAGGLLVEITNPTDKPVGEAVGEIRTLLRADLLPDATVNSATGTGANPKDIIVIRSPLPDETPVDEGEAATEQSNLSDQVVSFLQETYPQGAEGAVTWELLRKESVGPRVSGELLQAGILALATALVFMLGYIWFRFQGVFSVGAVAALAHDVILTIGIFSLLQIDFNLTTIAALLTIIGYSMNDTVVVYDRIREELRKYKKMPLIDVINLALSRTLSRTILTSGTTLLALLSIYFLGGEVLRSFSFALIWGVIIGTYSSIFVASAILLYLGLKRDPQPIADNPFESAGT